jgi:hypothetical protein
MLTFVSNMFVVQDADMEASVPAQQSQRLLLLA